MSKKNTKFAFLLLFAIFLAVILIFTKFNFKNTNNHPNYNDKKEKLLVMSSLFPWYDLVREIGGERVESVLLLPPGLEAHSYEPRPQDLVNINQADLFVYTNTNMEPWAADIFSSLNKAHASMAMAQDLGEFEIADLEEHELQVEDDHHHEEGDPHIWLDPNIMKLLANRLTDNLIILDAEGSLYYQNNLINYLNRLEALDADYEQALANCENREIIYAGHYAFAYLAHRYNLSYQAAQGISPNAESTPGRLVQLSQALKEQGASYVFKGNLENSQLAESLASANNIEIIELKTGANLSKDDYDANLSYEDLMRYNLEQLTKGLRCQK